MNSFTKQYYDIINKHFNKQFKQDNFPQVMKVIKKCIVDASSNYNNIAIWGAGQHTDNVMKYYSADLYNLDFIIENDIKKAELKYKGYKIIQPDEILKNNIDCIIISSFTYKNDIKKSILNLSKTIKIIDFYEELENQNIKLSLPFYMMSETYININDELINFKNAKNDYEKKTIIESLLENYIRINDFINVFKFINEYKNLKIENNNKFDELKIKLQQLLKKVKKEVEKKTGNISLMYIDALRYKDVFESNNMKYIRKIGENNIKFSNAFSTSITTYESMVSCLSGKLPLEDFNYKRDCIEEKECKFVKKALDENYEVNFYILGNDKFVNSNNINYKRGGEFCSQTLWRYITDIADSTNKNLSLLYFLQESHPPHIGGEHSQKVEVHVTAFSSTTNYKIQQSKREYIKQYKESLKYLDKQLKFYLSMLNDKNDMVIFSDHGQIIEQATDSIENVDSVLGWHDDRYKINFIIKSKNKIKRDEKKLFSLIDFNSIICGIMDDKVKINYRESVEMQFSRMNNKVIRQMFKNNGKKDFLNSFKVYRNKQHKLVITGKGKFRVFKVDGKDEPEVLNDIKKRFVISKLLGEV